MCAVYPATIRGGRGLLADALAVGRERWQRVARRSGQRGGEAALRHGVPAHAGLTPIAAGRDAGVAAGDA